MKHALRCQRPDIIIWPDAHELNQGKESPLNKAGEMLLEDVATQIENSFGPRHRNR